MVVTISERSALSIAELRQRHRVRQGDVRRRQAGEVAGWRSWGKRGVAGGADGGAGPVAVAGAGAARRRPAAVRQGGLSSGPERGRQAQAALEPVLPPFHSAIRQDASARARLSA